MVVVTTHTQQELEKRNEQNREMLSMNNQIYIRQSFDKALLTIEAESWIAIAKEEGFYEMAAWMEKDLKFETDTNFLI